MGKIIYHRDIKDQVIILDKERYIAARRLGIDIGFQASDQFRYLLFNSVK